MTKVYHLRGVGFRPVSFNLTIFLRGNEWDLGVLHPNNVSSRSKLNLTAVKSVAIKIRLGH